jgi:1-acyl-sn-glycerol-3-phosphate acyltransferase
MRSSLIIAIGCIAAGLGLFVAALPWIIRPLLFLLLSPRYAFRIVGRENVPRDGAVVLAINHVTWIDGFLIAAISPRDGKALVNSSYIDVPVLRWLAKRAGLIPIPSAGPKALRAAIQASKSTLDQGQALAIFPEAQISRNGLMGPFFRGVEVVLSDHPSVPVIPVYLDGLWGSLFSYSGGRFFRKRPQGWRRIVNIAFGPPVSSPVTAFAIRQAVQDASVTAYAMRDGSPEQLETIDLSLPHYAHPELGLLAVSTADFDRGGIHQTGRKTGSVGQAAPGVALRVVSDSGTVLGPDEEGRLQARVSGREGWHATSSTPSAMQRESGSPSPTRSASEVLPPIWRARLVHSEGWHDLGKSAKIDRDGFVRLS